MGSFFDFSGGPFYDNQAQIDAENLSRYQGRESLVRGQDAANLSDPFASQRPQHQKQLSTLLSNPGQIETSPFYKYLASTQMEAAKASNANQGFTRSGRGLMALQENAAGAATKAYFPQAQLLALLSGATTGSPAAAGQQYSKGSERSQDYGQQALAQRNYQPPAGPAERPWYDTPFFNDNGPVGMPSGGLPSGGYSQNYSSPSYDYYQPSYGNTLSSDYLTTNDDYGGYYDYAPEDYGYDDYYGYD